MSASAIGSSAGRSARLVASPPARRAAGQAIAASLLEK
jgi:hypothetical protein